MDERARECSAESRCGDDDAHGTDRCVIRGTTPEDPALTAGFPAHQAGREKDQKQIAVRYSGITLHPKSSRVEGRGTLRTVFEYEDNPTFQTSWRLN